MVVGLESGASYDVVVPGDMWIGILRQKKLLRQLDLSLIPNFETYITQPLFRSPPFDPLTDDTKYSVPYMFGTTGFAARLDILTAPDDSWGQLWDKRFKGKIGMLNGVRDAYSAALFLLGYSPNTTSQSELDEATQKLIEQKPLVGKYDSTRPTTQIVNGFAATECWDGDAIGAMQQIGLSKVRYVLPREGYLIWVDGLSIPASAKSPYAAHLFLNHCLDPKVAANNANYIGYQPAVEAADPMIKDMVQRAMRPTADVIEKGVFQEDLGEFNAAYDAGWKQVKAAKG
jgi:spermidine/putrescine transport system substrate-binding protein